MIRRPGHGRLPANTCWSPRSASTARQRAGSWPMWTSRISASASLKAIPSILGVAVATVPRPATINQVNDPERLLYPLKRSGPRGSGQWERTTWDEVLDTFSSRIRQALIENRRTEVMYHGAPWTRWLHGPRLAVLGGRRAQQPYQRLLLQCAPGLCPVAGGGPPSPDHSNARFILLISAHLETGHYFNPHAQRIIEAKAAGSKIAVIDTRLSNTASMADYWLSTWPGSEAALLLAMANVILQEERYNREFLRCWVNWEETLRALRPDAESTFDHFLEALKAHYATYTPAYAERETGVAAALIVQVAREIAAAGTAFAAHVWRSAASGNEGGWQVARCLEFLSVLTGSVGTRGGTSPNTWDKFVAAPFTRPAPQNVWNELLYPKEYPLSFHEMSFLLPHFLKSGRGRVDTYFTRVYNPVWTNPDGATWIEVLKDEQLVGLHAALTPVWSETAWFADYVLPMGTAAERHDLMSQETQAGSWIGFRQPVLRVVREKLGQPVRYTYETNPGEVWEEDEFWIEFPPGASTLMGASGCGSTLSRPIARAKNSPLTSITSGSSRTACLACPRGCRGPGPDAAGLHAQIRRLRRQARRL